MVPIAQMEMTILTIHPSIHSNGQTFALWQYGCSYIFFWLFFFSELLVAGRFFSRLYAVLIKKDITATMTTWHLYMRDCTKQIWIKTMDWRTTLFFSAPHSHIELEKHTYSPIFWFCNICVGIVFFLSPKARHYCTSEHFEFYPF